MARFGDISLGAFDLAKGILKEAGFEIIKRLMSVRITKSKYYLHISQPNGILRYDLDTKRRLPVYFKTIKIQVLVIDSLPQP